MDEHDNECKWGAHILWLCLLLICGLYALMIRFIMMHGGFDT